ncbi:hypothetical protein ACRQHA_08620 [Actinotignum sp. GS-2025b]|uniref:hypothetical protein n=1 Tax=Actinotignum sp. GS-2025b TaxID=3427275 RepID=UPI003F45C19D
MGGNAAEARSIDFSQDRRRVVHGKMFLLAFLGFFIYAMGLSLLTPLNGGPDETQHEIYGYAVVTGQIPQKSIRVEAPAFLRRGDPDCWRHDPAATAFCSRIFTTNDELISQGTSAVNYPPLYYYLTHWPLLLASGKYVLWGIRVLSAGLFAGLAALGFSSLYAGLRSAALPYLTIGLLAPGFYSLSGFSNPQSMEIGAALALTGFLLPLLNRVPAREELWRWIGGGLAAIPLICARPVGPYWAILLCLLFAIIFGRVAVRHYLRTPGFWIFLGLCALGCLAWFGWNYLASTYGKAPDPVANKGAFRMGLQILGTMPYYIHETIGTAGWRNVEPSSPVSLCYVIFFACLLIAVYRAGARHHRRAVIFGVVVLPFSALLLNTAVADRIPLVMWQGRYWFPFFFPFLVTCAAALLQHHELRERTDSARDSRLIPVLSLAGALLFAVTTIDFTVRMAWRFYVGLRTPVFAVLWTTPPRALLGLLLCVGLSCVVAYLVVRRYRPHLSALRCAWREYLHPQTLAAGRAARGDSGEESEAHVREGRENTRK